LFVVVFLGGFIGHLKRWKAVLLKFDRALFREFWTNLPSIPIAICSEIFL